MPVFRHLVFAGGGPVLWQWLGGVHALVDEGRLDLDLVETIHGTSAGGLMGLLIATKLPLPDLTAYLVRRPWYKVFALSVPTVVGAVSRRGLFDRDVAHACLDPVLHAVGLSPDTTLRALHEHSGVDVHVFAFDLHRYVLVDVNHETFPELPMVLAAQMTCAIPGVVSPVFWVGADGHTAALVDGGVAASYPLAAALKHPRVRHPDDVLGFRATIKHLAHLHSTLDEHSSHLFDLLLMFAAKAVFYLSMVGDTPAIAHELSCDVDVHPRSFADCFAHQSARQALYDLGRAQAALFATADVDAATTLAARTG